MREIRLTASDFAYLYRDCPRCAWFKVVRGISPPRGEFPSIFGKIDRLAKEALSTRESLAAIGLRGLTPVACPPKIKVKPFVNERLGITARMSCELDALWQRDDGSYVIPDLKTSDVSQEKAQIFAGQLHSYAYALMYPDDYQLQRQFGESVVIDQLLIASWMPDALELGREGSWANRTALSGLWRVHEVPVDFERFYKRIDGMMELAAQEEPPLPGERCSVCAFMEKMGRPSPEEFERLYQGKREVRPKPIPETIPTAGVSTPSRAVPRVRRL